MSTAAQQQQQPEMRVREDRLAVFLQSWLCDKCEDGEMRPTGFLQQTGGGVAHLHQCNKCSHAAAAFEVYPKVVHREIEMKPQQVLPEAATGSQQAAGGALIGSLSKAANTKTPPRRR